jgi:hypothetical protein
MLMNTDDRKRVLVPVDVVNEVLSEGPQEFMWNDQQIVLTEEDIPYESPEDCCFRSAQMLDGSDIEEELCQGCGRVFNVVHGSLERFDTNRADKLVLFVPHSEFLDN